MAGSFEYLNHVIEEKGLFKVLTFPIVALGAVGSLAAFAGVDGAPLIALAILALTGIVLTATSSLRVRKLQYENHELKEAVKNLREFTFDIRKPSGTLSKWRDEFTVGANGDLSARRCYTYRVDEGNPLHYVYLSPGGDPLTDREKSEMGFEVRLEPGGGRLPVEVEWVAAGQARLWAHLPKPLQVGDPSVTVVLTYRWPRTLAGLAQGGSDPRTQTIGWHTVTPTERLEYLIVLDGSHKRTQPLRYVMGGMEPPTQKPEAADWKIEGSAENLPAGRRYTIKLDAS